MNTQCGTHDNLGQSLRDSAKAALGEWYDNPTPQALMAFTTACEPLSNIEILQVKEELREELRGTAR